ncbi:unnamed protein product [Acanthoscelides obtectus]|uniref:Uncharacterized protein n=1 Tax=Acanthoscelides obtectus TaxID=200917 RepID=A0A9P0K124_ACAOB|nr:unnamed protein product [Acanthoscelides obtectus]CAK1669583.1 hypothetical protein AOBTE_LOCUS27091 [Acanthoscelides obtectus]
MLRYVLVAFCLLKLTDGRPSAMLGGIQSVPSVGMHGQGMLGTGTVVEKTSVAERTPLGGVQVSRTSVRPSGIMGIESLESPGLVGEVEYIQTEHLG